MNQLCITGVSGNIGSHIVGRLASEGIFDRIVGIDCVPCSFGWKNFRFVRADIVRDDYSSEIDNSDVVLHLAFVVGPSKESEIAERINVQGTMKLLSYFLDSPRTRTFIFLSSASVYGHHPDNPIPISEFHPPRPDMNRVYQRSKYICEKFIMEKIPKGKIWIILRPSLVYGPGFNNFLIKVIQRKVIFKLKYFNPKFQILHIDDLYSALVKSFSSDRSLLLNVSPDDYVCLDELKQLNPRIRMVNIPQGLVSNLVSLLHRWRFTMITQQDLSLFKYSIVIDNSKIKSALEWVPIYSTREIVLTLNRR